MKETIAIALVAGVLLLPFTDFAGQMNCMLELKYETLI